MTPLCSPNFRLGKPTSQCHFYSQTLTSLFEKYELYYSHTIFRYVINTHDLYSKETDRIIVVHADLVCIDYEGGALDACSLALLAALINLRIPSLSMKDDEVVFDYSKLFISIHVTS